MPEKILLTDPDGDQAILRNGKVTYKGKEYTHISNEEAAERILKGEEIKNAYIEAITRDTLLEAENRLRTGNLVEEAERDPDGHRRLTLRPGIRCAGCLIGSLELPTVNLRGGVEFRETTFAGRVNFSEATFGAEVYFLGATFGGEAGFLMATFGSGAHLWRVSFGCDASFFGASFHSEASFLGTAFGGQAAFAGATFGGAVNFRDCRFISCVLRGARFEKLCALDSIAAGELDLSHALFKEGFRLSAMTDRDRLASFHKETRKLVTTRKKRVLSSKEESEVALRKIEETERLLEEWESSRRAICSVNFEGTLVEGELWCDFDDLEPRKGRPVLKAHAQGDFAEAAKQYAWLKEQYRRRGAYGDEDRAHWWASECARRGTPLTGNRFWLLIPLVAAYLCYRILGPKPSLDASPLLIFALFGSCLLFLPRLGKWVVFRKAFGHGVRPQNIVITIGAVVAFFGLVFFIAHLTGDIVPHPGNDTRPAFALRALNSLYFSVITFATVGYGDARALGWAASAAMVEGLLGIILNAALVVVIFRKVVR